MGGADGRALDAENSENAPRKPVKHSLMLHLTPSRGSRAVRWHGRMEHLSEGNLVERTDPMNISRLFAVLTDTVKKITGKSP